MFNRVIAKGIDMVLVSALSFLGQVLWTPLGIVMAVLLCGLHDSFGSGQSVGKRIIGLRVIDDESGLPCTPRHSLLRNSPFMISVLLGSISSLWLLFVAVGAPLVILEIYLMLTVETGSRLGDILGHTTVVEQFQEKMAHR